MAFFGFAVCTASGRIEGPELPEVLIIEEEGAGKRHAYVRWGK
jgi:hypothetical protein